MTFDGKGKGYKQLVAEAEAKVHTLSAEEAKALHGKEENVFVDLRDVRELAREGKIPGALHCPRGMLEFWLDQESPYGREVFTQDKNFVFFCAGGWRSALATQRAQEMGLLRASHIGGGFGAWRKAEGAIEGGAAKEGS